MVIDITLIAYARVSIDGQTSKAQKYAIDAQFNVSKWFCDEAVSGITHAEDRPGLNTLLHYVHEGDIVVVAAIDRLGRNTVDVLETVEYLRAKGVSIISLREGFDLPPRLMAKQC